METLESALALLLAQAHPLVDTRILPLSEALGQVLAEDMFSPLAVPPFDRSPLDGYALYAQDTQGATRQTPRQVQVIGEICAGCPDTYAPLPGQAVRIMTGGQMPAGCDCVIRQEDTDEGMETALLYAQVDSGKNICAAGEDIAPGQRLCAAGERLTPAHIGVLASVGFSQVKVFRPVRAALLATGDELTQPGAPLGAGRIYDANQALLTARLRQLGIEVWPLAALGDDPAAVAQAIAQALPQVDLVLTTGGVSVGKKDIFHQVLPLLGSQQLFWRIAMKPGSPLMAGLCQGKLLLCLSGNPFAALACFELFAKPVLMKLQGDIAPVNPRVQTVLRGAFPKASPSRRLIRACFDGACVRPPENGHSSGSLVTAIGCNCLIDIPAGQEGLQDGDSVDILLL